MYDFLKTNMMQYITSIVTAIYCNGRIELLIDRTEYFCAYIGSRMFRLNPRLLDSLDRWGPPRVFGEHGEQGHLFQGKRDQMPN